MQADPLPEQAQSMVVAAYAADVKQIGLRSSLGTRLVPRPVRRRSAPRGRSRCSPCARDPARSAAARRRAPRHGDRRWAGGRGRWHRLRDRIFGLASCHTKPCAPLGVTARRHMVSRICRQSGRGSSPPFRITGNQSRCLGEPCSFSRLPFSGQSQGSQPPVLCPLIYERAGSYVTKAAVGTIAKARSTVVCPDCLPTVPLADSVASPRSSP